MDISWMDRIELFRYALAAALCASVVCPLIGVFLFVRRTSFYGITLPQFATAGVVFGFALLPWWVAHVGLGGLDLDTALSDSHAAMNYHFMWAGAFTFGGLITLVLLGRRGGSEIGRVAAAFAIANAATYLFGRVSPVGKSLVDELLQGEILGVGQHEFETLATVLGVVLVVVIFFHRDFLIASFDRDGARVLGQRVIVFEALLTTITGLTIAVGTMTLGPTLVFGLLVLPPLAARTYARSMMSFYFAASAIGVVSTLLGIVASFELDLPLGAAIVGVAGLMLVPGLVVSRFAQRA